MYKFFKVLEDALSLQFVSESQLIPGDQDDLTQARSRYSLGIDHDQFLSAVGGSSIFRSDELFVFPAFFRIEPIVEEWVGETGGPPNSILVATPVHLSRGEIVAWYEKGRDSVLLFAELQPQMVDSNLSLADYLAWYLGEQLGVLRHFGQSAFLEKYQISRPPTSPYARDTN